MSAVGATFPGGQYCISREENDSLCRAVGAEPDSSGRAHPIFYYIATQAGMGLSVDALLALCDFDVKDGPLMTGSSVTFHGELRVGVDYVVAGEIVSLTRKPSRTFGAVDLLSFSLELRVDGDMPVVSCTNQWVLPRRGAIAS